MFLSPSDPSFDLVDRGLDQKRRYLVVMDGSKALRAGVERVFGDQVEVQRCQIHKRRNVKEYLPENCQKDYDRRMRNAYAMNNYAEAKEALQKIFRQLERINPTAARSLEEGLEDGNSSNCCRPHLSGRFHMVPCRGE